MTCREAEKLIMPFIDMKLEEEELEAFLTHVSTCPECREELGTRVPIYTTEEPGGAPG